MSARLSAEDCIEKHGVFQHAKDVGLCNGDYVESISREVRWVIRHAEINVA